MNKIKVFLTVITILIAVTPITIQVIRYRENPVDLILPPSVSEILKGGTDDLVNADEFHFVGKSFPLPMLTGEPVLSKDNTVELTYNFTNPLDGKITITSMDAEIICTEHKFKLGEVFIEPATLGPHQTIDLDVTCILTPKAIEHITTQHKGQTNIKTKFKDFSVDLLDIKITMPHRKLGTIQIPLTTSLLSPFYIIGD
jgi:hypothetical protein